MSSITCREAGEVRDHTPPAVSSEVEHNNRCGSGGQPPETYILSSPDAVGASARRVVIFGPTYTTVDRLIGPDGPGEVQAETRVPDPRRCSTRTSRTHASPTTSLNGPFRPTQEPDHARPRGAEADDDRHLRTRPRHISRYPRPLRHHRRHRQGREKHSRRHAGRSLSASTAFRSFPRASQGSSKVVVGRSCLAILALGAARVPRGRGRPALERGQDALDPGTPCPQLRANADF